MDIQEWNKNAKSYGLKIVSRLKYNLLVLFFLMISIFLVIIIILSITLLYPLIDKAVSLYQNNSETVNNYIKENLHL